MSFPSLVRLLPGFLASLLACSAAQAQIHEEKATPGLEEGLMLHIAKTEHPVVYPTSPVSLAKPEIADFDTGDFSVCFWAAPFGGPGFPHGVLSKRSGEAGWSIGTGDSVVAIFDSPALKSGITMQAAWDSKSQSWHHIAAVFRAF